MVRDLLGWVERRGSGWSMDGEVGPNAVGMRNYRLLAGIPVEGKSSSECLICMKYRIIILIIIFSLGQIFYRILQTHHACTHAGVHTRTRAYACACTHTRTRAHARTRTREHMCTHTAVPAVTVRRTGYRYSSAPSRDRQLRWHS